MIFDDKSLNFCTRGAKASTCGVNCAMPIVVLGNIFSSVTKLLTSEDYKEIKSLHDWKKWEHNEELTWGEWCKPVWPKTRSLMGSVPTPYIFDDRCDWEDAGNAIKQWYEMGKESRKECGLKGHEFAKGDESMQSVRWMGKNFINHMETAFEKWTPRKRIHTYKV